MGLLDKLFKLKKTETVVETVEQVLSPLQKICGNDGEVYQALSEVMFLDPTKVKISMDEAVKKAEEFEKQGNKLRAKVYYRIAGSLAVYKADVAKVKRYFGKAQKLAGEKYAILQNPEKALAKAQEYYRQYLTR